MAEQKKEAPSGGGAQVLELDSFVPYRLVVLANSVSRELGRQYHEQFGISVPEFRVLTVLGCWGALSAQMVALRASMDKSKVSRAISRLTAAKLVTRDVDPKDNRAVILKLSRRGRRLYDRVVPLARGWEAEFLDNLSARDRDSLDRILKKLQDHFQGSDQMAPGE